ncbi:DNA mismatch repair endonuclease MutL [bacterium]|nr:DNA mismatch repair endonuclease MutL [bacterium]
MTESANQDQPLASGLQPPKRESLLPRGQILVLPEGVANRIAAGEVVERPASVVKELIENALDAEASRITIAVRNAGFDELLVSDDGWGMDADDVLTALRRHATSKIHDAEDLQQILHLGFRGEALPSIGSVSRLEIVSKRDDRDAGVRYRVEGGQEVPAEPAARERGTTVKVRSLFYNVPARRKFLRTPSTEYGHVVRVFKRYALAYPDIAWELLREGDTVYQLEPADLKQRIAQLFGEDNATDLHQVESRSGDIFVSGLLGGTSMFRRSRGDQYLFINRRPFQSHALHHAVVNGFGPLIEPGQVPFYVLNMRLSPDDFDVNVHPAKHEIRFKDDSNAYRAVLVAIRNALGLAIKSGDAPVKAPFASSHQREEQERRALSGRSELELMFGRPPEERPTQQPAPGGMPPTDSASTTPGEAPTQQPIAVPPPPRAGEKLFQRGAKLHEGEAGAAGGFAATFNEAATATDGQEQSTEAPLAHEAQPAGMTTSPNAERINVWQVHRTYILSQTKSGLVIIDQHVAHERILFEKALAAMRNRAWSGQNLLFPTQVTLDPEDSALLEDIAPSLSKVGFEVESFGGRDWVIRSVPAGIRIRSEEKLLRDIVADFRQEHQVRMEPEESLAASFACKAAIKAGDLLNREEMNALIDELFTTEYPFVCPHGRPVVVNLTLGELHRLFGRE